MVDMVACSSRKARGLAALLQAQSLAARTYLLSVYAGPAWTWSKVGISIGTYWLKMAGQNVWQPT